MGGRQGKVDEERLVIMLSNTFQDLVSEVVKDLLMDKARGCEALSPKPPA